MIEFYSRFYRFFQSNHNTCLWLIESLFYRMHCIQYAFCCWFYSAWIYLFNFQYCDWLVDALFQHGCLYLELSFWGVISDTKLLESNPLYVPICVFIMAGNNSIWTPAGHLWNSLFKIRDPVLTPGKMNCIG